MGITSSSFDRKDSEITKLKEKLREKNANIELLKQQIQTLRSINIDESQINDDDLTKINDTWDNKDYKYIVFSGGGVKGISFAGSLQVLEKLNILYNEHGEFKLKGVAGASAGSIIASLLGVGYNVTEILDIMDKVNFKKISNDGEICLREGYDLLSKWGFCEGRYLLELLGNLIKNKTGNNDYTIEDLYNDKGIELVIVATDINRSKSTYFYPGNPIKEYSNIPIRTAIRLSMGIPLLFEPYSYNDTYFADGGILDNFPLHVFDGEYPGDIEARLNLCQPNPKVLGIQIMTNNEEINYELVKKQEINNLIEYATSYINLFLSENERRIMTPLFWLRSIIIITPDYPVTQFNITDKEQNELVDCGRKYAEQFFTKKKSFMFIKNIVD
jgi:NTE family protein